VPSPDLTKKKWWNLPAVLPNDGWTVRLRVHRTSAPLDATFTLPTGLFTPTLLPAIPATDCTRWRLFTWPPI